jgi:hypothetical protein
MQKLLSLLLLLPALAFGQTVPNGGITNQQIWTTAQWIAAWQGKADTASPALTGTPLINGVPIPSTVSPAFTGTPTIAGVPIPTNPQTAAEIAAAVTPTNYAYPAGNVLRYGADLTGATDVSAALIKAASIHGIVIIPPGQYLLNGTATVALNNVQIECQGGPPNASTNYGTSGSTFLLTSTSVQPFTIGNGVRIKNCTFYWPNQTGTTSTPTAYPPLFTEVSGQQLANFDLDGVRVVNAYDVIGATSVNDPMGNIHLTDTYGYAIRYWLNLANVVETCTIKGMSADWNLFQNVANSGPNYYLVKWTAANGAFLHVFGNGNGTTATSTVIVSGLVYDGAVFAYNKFIWVDSTGGLTESLFHGIADAVPHVLEVDSGGIASDVRIEGAFYSFQWNPPSGGAGGADNATEFTLNSPASGFNGTTGRIEIEGQNSTSQGDVMDITGAYISSIRLSLHGNGVFARTTTAGTYYFANINSSTAQFEAIGNYLQPLTAGTSSRGFLLTNCYMCSIIGNQFNGVYNPIAVGSASVPFVAHSNIGVASPAGSNAIVGTGSYVHTALIPGSNYWDTIIAPSVSACGGGTPTVNGGSTDTSGSINIGTGTPTTCTLGFNQAYSIGPKCLATTTSGAAYTASVSGSQVVFNFPSAPSGALWYSCVP